MANSLIKWCKSKLFNGYKHINVEGGNVFTSCRSDTETLVRSAEEDFLLATPTVGLGHENRIMWKEKLSNYSRLESSDTANDNTCVEEMTCDVSVSTGAVSKQEFYFTLYDFDGHGKITKDDIASLVQSIYEAVGSSLSLPPSGSRTIRVKLTVAPEVADPAPPIVRSGVSPPSHPPKDRSGNSPRSLQGSPIIYSPRGLDDLEVVSSPGGRSPPGDGNPTPRKLRRRRGGGRRTSLHRQELFQIIQANMEKNNLFYPHRHYHRRRRRHCHCGCPPSGGAPTTPPAMPHYSPLKKNCACRCPKGGHVRSRSQDYVTETSPRVDRTQPHPHPQPPSNTPDRPPSQSPKSVHHHHHNHSHGRSRSVEERPQQLSASAPSPLPSPGGVPSVGTPAAADDSSQVVALMKKSPCRDGKVGAAGGGGPAVGGCGRSHHVHYHHHYHHYPHTPPLII